LTKPPVYRLRKTGLFGRFFTVNKIEKEPHRDYKTAVCSPLAQSGSTEENF
jgi:hypothetical protein